MENREDRYLRLIREALVQETGSDAAAQAVFAAIKPMVDADWESLLATIDQAKELAKTVNLYHDFEDKAFNALQAAWNYNPASRRMIEELLQEYYPEEWRSKSTSRDWTDPLRKRVMSVPEFARRDYA